jgi:hypothetical protein
MEPVEAAGAGSELWQRRLQVMQVYLCGRTASCHHVEVVSVSPMNRVLAAHQKLDCDETTDKCRGSRCWAKVSWIPQPLIKWNSG